MLHTFLMIIHFFCAAAIVALVLLQRGKGAEAGAGFGAGASGTVFGARGASTALSRATAVLAAIFMVTSLSLAYVGARKSSAPANSLLDQLATPSTPANTSRCRASSAAAARVAWAASRHRRHLARRRAVGRSGGGAGQRRASEFRAGDAQSRRAGTIRARTDRRRRGGIGRHTSLRG
jgi:preprotein translocase subunit SecG